VLQVVRALGTSKVGAVIEGQRRFDLALRLPQRYRDDPRRIGTILVEARRGERVPLAQLVTIRVRRGPLSCLGLEDEASAQQDTPGSVFVHQFGQDLDKATATVAPRACGKSGRHRCGIRALVGPLRCKIPKG